MQMQVCSLKFLWSFFEFSLTNRGKSHHLLPQVNSRPSNLSSWYCPRILRIQCDRIQAVIRPSFLLQPGFSRCVFQISIHSHSHDHQTIPNGLPALLHNTLFHCRRSYYNGWHRQIIANSHHRTCKVRLTSVCTLSLLDCLFYINCDGSKGGRLCWWDNAVDYSKVQTHRIITP